MKGPSTGETQEGRVGLHAWSFIAILCPPLISLVLELAMLSFDGSKKGGHGYKHLLHKYREASSGRMTMDDDSCWVSQPHLWGRKISAQGESHQR